MIPLIEKNFFGVCFWKKDNQIGWNIRKVLESINPVEQSQNGETRSEIYWNEYKDQEIPSAYRLAWSNIFMSKQEGELMVSLVTKLFPLSTIRLLEAVKEKRREIGARRLDGIVHVVLARFYTFSLFFFILVKFCVKLDEMF